MICLVHEYISCVEAGACSEEGAKTGQFVVGRVTAPSSVYQDPDQDPTLKKKPDPGPDLTPKEKPDLNPALEK